AGFYVLRFTFSASRATARRPCGTMPHQHADCVCVLRQEIIMGQYIARRLAQLLPVVFGITLVLFFMLRLIPGDPTSVRLGERATDAAVARLNHELGLDKPIYIQYFYFLRQLATFDLGTSIRYQIPVAQLLGQRLLISLSVVAVTLVLT